jgi:hypothetical protein
MTDFKKLCRLMVYGWCQAASVMSSMATSSFHGEQSHWHVPQVARGQTMQNGEVRKSDRSESERQLVLHRSCKA